MSGPGSRLSALVSDEGTGARLPERPGAHLKRLHRCRRGNISLLVLFMGFVFYGLAAMVWNTGQVTSAKIEAQTAADAAAYSSAVWTSRAINMTTGANMLILRHATGGVSAFAAVGIPLVIIMVPVNWIQWVSQTCAGATGPWYPLCAIPAWISLLPEIIAYASYLIQALPGLPQTWESFINIAKLRAYQDAWIAAVPGAIEQERQQLQDYFGCEIRIVRADGGPLEPPLRRGNPLTCVIPYFARVFAEVWQNSDSWRNSDEFDIIVRGKAKTWWNVSFLISMMIMWPYMGFNHTVLSTQFGPLEFGPEGLNAWDEFTVIAAARKLDDNTVSGQPPRHPLRFMAPGIFPDPVNPVAYAQAETFNGIDGHLSVGPLQYLAGIYPFRVWTTWGWQWQPRLNDGDLLPNAAWDVFDFPVGPDVVITAPADVEAVLTH